MAISANELERNLRNLLKDLSLVQAEPRPINSEAEDYSVPKNSEAEDSEAEDSEEKDSASANSPEDSEPQDSVSESSPEDSELQDSVSEGSVEEDSAPQNSEAEDSASENLSSKYSESTSEDSLPKNSESDVDMKDTQTLEESEESKESTSEDSASDVEMGDMKEPEKPEPEGSESEDLESTLECSAPGSSDESHRDISPLDVFTQEDEKNKSKPERKSPLTMESQAKSNQVLELIKEPCKGKEKDKENSNPNVYSNVGPAMFLTKKVDAPIKRKLVPKKNREGQKSAHLNVFSGEVGMTAFFEHRAEVMAQRQDPNQLPQPKRLCSK